ncbi:unnamed protein product [Penicillium nalgiovense]|nr:unnamed protein product [Penicillium nalgiovense]
MAPRSEVAWEVWEEKQLLPWLDAHRALPWKSRSHAYYEQYQVDRSVESVREKYHILRKQRRAGSGSPRHAAHRNRAEACRSVGRRASLGNVPSRRPAQSNIEKCFQKILKTEPSHIDSIESAKGEGFETRPRDAITPPLTA